MVRSKVCYDLNKSNFTVFKSLENAYGREIYVILTFSSEYYREKFESLAFMDENVKFLLSKYFKSSFDCELLEIIFTYASIEKRGFLVTIEDKKYTRIEDIKYTISYKKD